MALKTNLISYYKLDESSGNAADSHGSNTLTNNGTTPFVAGILNNGADFEQDSTQYFSIADASQSGFDFSGDMSFAGWVFPESLPSGAFTMDPLISKWSSTSNQRAYRFGIARDGGNVLSLGFNHSGDGSASTSNYANNAFSTATWYYIAMVYDAAAGSVEFFVNGSSIGTATGLATSTFNSTQQFELGANSQQSEYCDGIADEVSLWSRKVTSAELTQIYNSGTPLPYGSWDAGGGGASTPSNHWLLMGV